MNTETPSSLERQIQQQQQIVSLIRWSLSLTLFAVVFFYEMYEHIVVSGESWLDVDFTFEILFFGIVGPSAVFVVLSYVRRLMQAQWKTQTKLDQLNYDLQRKVAERTAELEARNTELQQLDEMKSEFVALVSHELRAPLTTLQGSLELALQQAERLPVQARNTLQVMRVESQRLATFVKRILDLSRLEAGRLPIVLGPVALRPLLERSVAVTISDARPIEWDLPAEVPLLLGDETHLEEAIRNVITNAHKYAPDGSPLHIEVGWEGSSLELSIIDHGPGIDASAQKHIFDRFYRGNIKGDVQDSPGWGLGLYLARHLLEAQNGKLSVRSPAWPDSDSPGAAFILTLPLDVAGELNNARRANN